ncbi:unnamed protein product [Dicrocoelium dendriticum]|nr:unnamed protein product [Dicrocoelium dendriticum]
MVQLHEESLLRKKGAVGDGSVYDMKRKGIDSNEDDFFLIGPSNERFAHLIAYRNRLKHRMHGQYPSLNDTSTQFGPSAQQTTCVKKTQVQNTAAGRRNEATQTEGPRAALEMEIHRIREDLERRKRGLRNEAKNTDKREKHERREDRTKAHSSAMEQTQNERHIQRPKTSKMTTDVTMYQSMSPPMRRQHSFSARTQRGLSEYQWAYRTPEKSYYIRPSRSVENIGNQSSTHFEPRIAVIDYETEYQHEYKPFKYVTEENLKSTCVTNEAKIHVVPLPRSRSAIAFKRWSHQPDTRQTGKIAPTPHEEKRENRKTPRRRHLSESSAKYRDYSDPKKIGQWLREFAELRQQAESYCSRERGSHFTRDHLAQLDSTYVKCWDDVNSERCPENCIINRTTSPNSQTGKIEGAGNLQC